MKRCFLLNICILAFCFVASSQIKITIPKIGQPKPTPSPTSPPVNNPTTSATPKMPNKTGQMQGSSGDFPARLMATDTPVFQKSTLDVRVDMENRYWKLPNESNYTSWIPQVKFNVFYKGNVVLRYKAEYFTPDGKPWFSEPIEQLSSNLDNQTVQIGSGRGSNRFDKISTITIGTYGVKITNMRDDSVVFEGKFKVNKYKYGPQIPMFKNQAAFYVEQDWNLPIGSVWLNYKSNLDSALPTVSMWIKGDIRAGDLEARLFHNGLQIMTTDDMGEVNTTQDRHPNIIENKELAYWKEWSFGWYKFMAVSPKAKQNYPKASLLSDMPGEYTVKVYFKGEQIRETKFSVANGNFADNGIGKQNNFAENKIFIPVKVMGTLDKWNTTQWKTDAFYGNPLSGFSLQ